MKKSLLEWLNEQAKRRILNYSPQSRRAIELLNDPKWSWNRFPRKQINFVTYFLRHPIRSIKLHLDNSIDWIAKKTVDKIEGSLYR